MKAKLLLATVILFGFGINTTDAQIKQHSKHQHYPIKEGVKSGELTKAETKNLVHDQREIHQDVKQARADGVVTRGEKKEIRGEQRKASREISRKKHNRRDRG